jgi:S1-C subfamily serine protease
MTSRKEIDELIERYCLGQLTPEELRIFEQWRESDHEMAEAIDNHRLIVDAFRVYAERVDLKQKIAAIHDEMETEQYSFKAPLKVVEKKESKVRFLWKRYRVAAVAAVTAVVAVSATILSYDYAGVGSGKNQKSFQELRREVEKIKRNQKAIIKDINSAAEPKEQEGENNFGFTGTGFALSSDGYVLTSYHVVADAKSIFINNEKVGQVKMKTVYTDKTLDLAVLIVDDNSFKSFGDLPYSFKKAIADPGEKVYTLGFPREDLVYGEGSISSYTGFEGDTASYQVSIPVNPGNSGGPLFDGQGNLLGIISGRNASAEGASFAVKSRWISEYISQRKSDAAIVIPSKKNLKGADRPTQIKKLKDFVFMVKVYN